MLGSGCKNCPVKPCHTLHYRGSYCAEQRAKHGLGDPQTNGDRIRAMTDEELAEWFASLAYGRNTPWCEQFARKFCDNCPSEMYKIKETGKVMRLYECDFADGKCPHGSDIVWWLQQPVEEKP